MENKKLQKLSMLAIAVSILPLTTFVPILLNISLSDGIRSIWSGVNLLSILVGLILSISCVKSSHSRSVVNIAPMIISSFWLLLLAGIFILALFLNFVPK